MTCKLVLSYLKYTKIFSLKTRTKILGKMLCFAVTEKIGNLGVIKWFWLLRNIVMFNFVHSEINLMKFYLFFHTKIISFEKSTETTQT